MSLARLTLLAVPVLWVIELAVSGPILGGLLVPITVGLLLLASVAVAALALGKETRILYHRPELLTPVALVLVISTVSRWTLERLNVHRFAQVELGGFGAWGGLELSPYILAFWALYMLTAGWTTALALQAVRDEPLDLGQAWAVLCSRLKSWALMSGLLWLLMYAFLVQFFLLFKFMPEQSLYVGDVAPLLVSILLVPWPVLVMEGTGLRRGVALSIGRAGNRKRWLLPFFLQQLIWGMMTYSQAGAGWHEDGGLQVHTGNLDLLTPLNFWLVDIYIHQVGVPPPALLTMGAMISLPLAVLVMLKITRAVLEASGTVEPKAEA